MSTPAGSAAPSPPLPDYAPETRRGRVIAALRAARGQVVATRNLVELLYADDPNGGPVTARECVHNMMHLLRKRGFPIRGHGGRGGYWWTGPLDGAA